MGVLYHKISHAFTYLYLALFYAKITSMLEITPEFELALQKMESGKAFVFITGRAGTGKSTLLKHFTKNSSKNIPVLAPTGVAALNVEGETIHRFFRFSPGVTLSKAKKDASFCPSPEIYQKIDAIIIDEISMVRADLFDCMDIFLKKVRKNHQPFGGVRIIGIGDLYQLPPVVTKNDREAFLKLYTTPYFFSSKSFYDLEQMQQTEIIELEKIYRQKDQTFISILNNIRNKTLQSTDLEHLNSRILTSSDPDSIILTATNEIANNINLERLNALPGDSIEFQGCMRGDFPEREMPTDTLLNLKINARVMCVANDPKHQFVNGSLGWVRGFNEQENGPPTIMVELDETNKIVEITPHAWNIYRSTYNQSSHSLDQEQVGSFEQIPLKLAWAVTIHKSQGKTFNKMTLDLGFGAFAAGQVYVALSRCRSLKGLALKKPLTHKQIILDENIESFIEKFKKGEITQTQSPLIKSSKHKVKDVNIEQLDIFKKLNELIRRNTSQPS
jgi:ATP-dependent DNA helicase PIF1